MSWPGITVSDTDASRSGGLSLGSNAPAEATIRRAVRPGVTSACSARALDLSVGKAFEGGEEEASVLGRPLDVCVGRHDEEGAAPRG